MKAWEGANNQEAVATLFLALRFPSPHGYVCVCSCDHVFSVWMGPMVEA